MDASTTLKFAAYTFDAIGVVLPSLLVLPLVPKLKEWRPVNRYLLAILITWIVLVLYNDNYYLGARMQHAAHRGHPEYDGLALNGIIFLFGWVMPLITAIPALIIARVSYNRKKSTEEELVDLCD